jgi:hypothetical protein
MIYGVTIFHTTSAVMKAEKLLASKKIATKLIPVPRQFSSDCGLALRFNWEQREVIESELKSADVEMAGIHQMPSA